MNRNIPFAPLRNYDAIMIIFQKRICDTQQGYCISWIFIHFELIAFSIFQQYQKLHINNMLAFKVLYHSEKVTREAVVLYFSYSTHWGRVTHICVSKLTISGSDNGLSPGRHQAIIWTNAGILLIRSLRTNFNEMLIEILTFSFMKMRLKVSSAKWRPFCLGLNVLRTTSDWDQLEFSCQFHGCWRRQAINSHHTDIDQKKFPRISMKRVKSFETH